MNTTTSVLATAQDAASRKIARLILINAFSITIGRIEPEPVTRLEPVTRKTTYKYSIVCDKGSYTGEIRIDLLNAFYTLNGTDGGAVWHVAHGDACDMIGKSKYENIIAECSLPVARKALLIVLPRLFRISLNSVSKFGFSDQFSARFSVDGDYVRQPEVSVFGFLSDAIYGARVLGVSRPNYLDKRVHRSLI